MLAEVSQFDCVDRAAVACGIRIAGISLGLLGHSHEDLRLSPGLGQFLFSVRSPDITIDIDWIGSIRSHRGATIFDSGAAWSLSRDGCDLVFDFSSEAINSHPYKRLIVNPAFTRAQLLLSREALEAHRPISPLEYPADELIVTNYLAHHGLGVEVHGCGLVDSEFGGHLLLGHSGAGKSTTTKLWQSLRNPEILSDDRIILRLQNGELWMYGTPWHGEGRFASPGKARINKILVLQHGDRNQFVEFSRSLAAGELFARCFPPFHSPMGLEGTIEFLDRVVNSVPCYEFRFVPDAGAVEAVIEMDYATVH
jgi:hypothetical protein